MHYTSWNNLLGVMSQIPALTPITRHMANHVVGVYNEGGTVTQDYNLFYGNITNAVSFITATAKFHLHAIRRVKCGLA